MELPAEQQADSLAALEERIRQITDMVTRLRREREAALAEKQAAERAAGEARSQAATLARELETLRAERSEVRTRLEKLLAQIDALTAG